MKVFHRLFVSVISTAMAVPGLEAQVRFTLLQSIPPPIANVQLGAQLGRSVALDGAYAVVGAPYDDVSADDGGVVKVFDSTTGALRHVIFNPSPETGDLFGSAVAISGTWMVVGAHAHDTGTVDAGSAYVYNLGSGTPTVPVASLKNPAPGAGDFFGKSVAISGKRVMVAAPSDNTGAEDAGSLYVYDLESATPTVPAFTLNNPDPNPGDGFGSSIATSGSRLVVGAPFDDSFGLDTGTGYVYDFASPTPTTPVHILHDPRRGIGAFRWGSGSSVGISDLLVVMGGAPWGGGIGEAYLFDLSSVTPTVGAKLERPADLRDSYANVVAISGMRALVRGSTAASDNVYVYDLTTKQPVLTLTGSASDEFGKSAIAISGTRVLVGAPAGTWLRLGTGEAYLFDLASATPTVATPAQNDPGPALNDAFGFAVAISGTRVVVGARLDDSDAGIDTGSAHVYDLSGSTPRVPVATLHDPNKQFRDDQFGNSVAISGTRVVVGAWLKAPDEFLLLDGGSAYVYELSSGTPTVPTLRLKNPSFSRTDLFGSSVAISGTLAVVGAPTDNTGQSRAGSAYVYNVANGSSAPVATLTHPGPAVFDQFGTSVAIAGTRLVVGAPGDSTGAAAAGSAYVYELNGPTPAVPVGTLNNPGPSPQDSFGNAVAISGTRMVVGAWKDDTGATDAGSAYVYDLSSATPTVPTVILNNPHPGADASFGVSVATSGTRVVVGAAWDSTGASGAGSAYVYDLTSPTPTVPVATLQKQTPGAMDTFGYAVAIDDTTIAIGAPSDDAFMRDEGYAYVFGLNAPEIVVTQQTFPATLADGGSQSFGSVFVNGASDLSFNITNSGPIALTGIATSIDGPNAADFTITSSPAASLSGPNGRTFFTVRFSPGSLGARTATLHIASNDSDESPFDVTFDGTGIVPVSQVVDQGSAIALSVAALGVIQWRKDGVDIPGAVGGTLAIGSVQPWQIGLYSARVTAATGASVRDVAVLGLTGVASEVWRGLVACYPFNGSAQDLCRPGKPAGLVNTTELVADAQRGGVAQIRGKGWAVPPLAGEPVELQGPGGYLQIPRPPLLDGEPFTVSFVIKEEGLSMRHGESLFTMGEGAASTDLLAHYWVGSLDGFQEIYAGPTQAVWNYNSDYVVDGSAVTLNSPWTGYTLVADGNILHLYRNGQLMGTSPYKKETLGDSFIGRHWWENGAKYSTRLRANVDDLRIYNRALTGPEVQQLYSLVQTTPASGSFESWALIHGLSGTDAGQSADPDRDGWSNWEEHCFGTSPADGTESLLKAVLAGTTLTLTWLERDGVLYSYSLKETSDLVLPWTASAKVPTLSADQTGVPSGYQRKQVDIPVPQSGAPAANQFFRVEAVKGP